jgi:hypothetical protein
MMRCNEKKSQERVEAMVQGQQEVRVEQTNLLRSIQDAVANNTALLKNVTEGISEKMRLTWLSSLGSDLRQYMGNVFTINVATFRMVSELRTALPSHLERTLIQEPFLLEDALGRISPVHSQFINSWEAFDAVIQIRFQNQQGYSKILKKEFILQERETRRDISRTEPWESTILPGQKIDMSMVFTHTHNPYQMYCPACLHVCEKFSKAGTQWYDLLLHIQLI